MELNWLQGIIYGLFSGLADILPVSAQAHQLLLLKFFGVRSNSPLSELLIHLAVFAALYFSTQTQLIRMNRARALARVPKKKRKRPLDTRSLMDWRLLVTMVIPAVLGLFLYRFTENIRKNLMLMSLFLFANGVLLYIPQFLPTGNRDSRTLSRVEGLLMGFGGLIGGIPGVSSVGAAVSLGSICGVEHSFCLTMVLMMNMVIALGRAILDAVNLVNGGLGLVSLMGILQGLVTAVAAFLGTTLGIRIMRHLAEKKSYSLFGVYCWGLALFTFVVNLIV